MSGLSIVWLRWSAFGMLILSVSLLVLSTSLNINRAEASRAFVFALLFAMVFSAFLSGYSIRVLLSDRARAELSLKKSEERFRQMADNIQEIFWMMDAATNEVIYVNQAYATITGHSIEALYEHPSSYSELIHPQDRIRVLTKLLDASTDGSFDEEFQFIHANGTVRWVWVKGFPVRGHGFTRWLVGTAQDITSRKEAEKQITEHLDAAEAARAEAEALRRSTLALSQNLAMDKVLDTLLACISDLVPYKTSAVLFVEDGVDLLIAREAPYGQKGRVGLTLNASKCVFLQRILFERKAILVPDTSREPQWKSVVPLDGARAWLGIPLSAGGRILGILSLGSPKPNEFTSEHLRLAKALAVSAAVAIQNARVHERAEIYAAELERRLRELQSPTQTAQAVTCQSPRNGIPINHP